MSLASEEAAEDIDLDEAGIWKEMQRTFRLGEAAEQRQAVASQEDVGTDSEAGGSEDFAFDGLQSASEHLHKQRLKIHTWPVQCLADQELAY